MRSPHREAADRQFLHQLRSLSRTELINYVNQLSPQEVHHWAAKIRCSDDLFRPMHVNRLHDALDQCLYMNQHVQPSYRPPVYRKPSPWSMTSSRPTSPPYIKTHSPSLPRKSHKNIAFTSLFKCCGCI
ncbi:hypothetical protein Ciccas_011069 [Cichlidogyrus casuarinus]|uniref:Uncharacterized protein n=1 Tax=Cichlidogyrus casuarinus TaxID=1844966 RepID=A0ABD2PTH2_9PLAT